MLITVPPASARSLFKHLMRPARGGAAGVLIVFSILGLIAAHAGLYGIPLGVILVSWFFKYGYVLLDYSARGLDQSPVLDISMLNPLDEQRPLAQLLIVVAVASVVVAVGARLSLTAAWLLSGLSALALPASIAVLGIEGNPFKAVYPPALARMIAGLGVFYLLVLAVVALYIGLAWVIAKIDLGFLLECVFDSFALLSVFSVLGGALYERRHELGLDAWHSPERTDAREREARHRRDAHEIAEAYALTRANQHIQAWEKLQAWLQARGHAIEDYHWLCERAAAWGDPRYVTRLTEEYVERLLRAKRTGEALEAVAARLRADSSFRPKSAASTLKLAELAARAGGRRGVARTLLGNFAERFAGDPLLASANALKLDLGE